ncbi:DNA break repair nuclease [Podila humilis]|nr:DNA break repair nuclease [Podila humilis]
MDSKRKLVSLEQSVADCFPSTNQPCKKRPLISLRRPITRSSSLTSPISPPSPQAISTTVSTRLQSTSSTTASQHLQNVDYNNQSNAQISIHILEHSSKEERRLQASTEQVPEEPCPNPKSNQLTDNSHIFTKERTLDPSPAFISNSTTISKVYAASSLDTDGTLNQRVESTGSPLAATTEAAEVTESVSLDATTCELVSCETQSLSSSSALELEQESEQQFDPDCNEELYHQSDMQEQQRQLLLPQDDGADFELDEIENWSDNEDVNDSGSNDIDLKSAQGTATTPTPDMSCPLCGLDLKSLNTMTPSAHVNRCLDGSLDTGPQNVPEVASPNTTLPAPSSPPPPPQQSQSGAISSILGSIRSVITNLPLLPHNQPHQPPPQSSKPTQSKPSAKKFKPRVNRPCPFYKKMPDTDFTVDAFCYGAVEGCGAYFLSHFHSDHYGGLTSTWSHGPIYCSSITANLVISRLRVDEKWVRRLPMDKPTEVNGVTVTLMDANHCPGSVLFVFDLQTPNKRRYLHTGDFRALPEMCLDPVLCQPVNRPIDILYLDTTYSNPRYTFPSQKLVISETVRAIRQELGLSAKNDAAPSPPQLLPTAAHNLGQSKPATPVKKFNIMENWLKRESGNAEKLKTLSLKPAKTTKSEKDWNRSMETRKVVVCVGTYLIGKERVWMALAKSLETKVFVQPAKRQILLCLEDSEITEMLTTNPREAQVHLMHMGSDMSPDNLQEYLDKLSPTFTRLIAVRPTGWTFSGGNKMGPSSSSSSSSTDFTPQPTPTTLELRPSYTSPMVKIYPVPYSEHSSFNELAGFVRSLNILRIIPTVGVGSEKGRHAMTHWFERWTQERHQGIGWL